MFKEDKFVFSHMQDDISREIYKNRIAYSNGNMGAIENIIATVRGGKQLIDFMDCHYNDLYIFGAGILGKEFARTWLWKYPFQGVIDNDENKHGQDIEGIPIIGLQDIEAKNRNDTAIIIVNKFSHQEIEKQLRQKMFIGENIFIFTKFYLQLNRVQYFDLETMNRNQKERFVDCGALDGTTSMSLYEWYQGNVDKIWLFEPDPYSAEKCRQNFKRANIKNYEIIEKAVYSSDKELQFENTGNGMASISSNGDITVSAVSLDDILGEEEPTFIKMDIEGAELEAIKGAKNIIKKLAPKLAVCVYHKPEDIQTIPRLLLEYNPNYKFYLRHYSLTMNETVLYAL